MNFVMLLDASRLKYLWYQAITTRIFFAECKSTREILNQTLAKSDKNDETLCDWIENDKTSLQMLYHPFYNYDQFTTNYGCTEPLMRKLLSQDIENSKDIIYNEKTILCTGRTNLVMA